MFNPFHKKHSKGLDDFDIVVDVRTPEEFHMEHIEKSINIPLDQIENNLNNTEFHNFPKNKKILLVCRSGGRAGVAEMILRHAGFTNIENGGGFVSYK